MRRRGRRRRESHRLGTPTPRRHVFFPAANGAAAPAPAADGEDGRVPLRLHVLLPNPETTYVQGQLLLRSICGREKISNIHI
jgi:hypothetical protein